METGNNQELENGGFPTPKQFRTKFQEIFEAETNFGSARAARLELLEGVIDIIKEYLNHACPIVYLHGKLKEAGYSGSRKELSEWLVEKGVWTKREVSEKNRKPKKMWILKIHKMYLPIPKIRKRKQKRQRLLPVQKAIKIQWLPLLNLVLRQYRILIQEK